MLQNRMATGWEVWSQRDEKCSVGSRKEGRTVICYVDDLLKFTEDQFQTDRFKASLSQQFVVMELGRRTKFFSIDIDRPDFSLCIGLRQWKLIKKLLFMCGTQDTRPCPTSMTFEEQPPIKKLWYTVISCTTTLLYLALEAQPDISVVITVLGFHTESPEEKHFVAARNSLR